MSKCMVRWEGKGECRGPFEVDGYGVNWVRLDHMDGYLPGVSRVPRSWTLGVDDGWTLWEGGECPVGSDTRIDMVLRNGRTYCDHRGVERIWIHDGTVADVVAYRVVEDRWRDWIPGQGQPRETRGKRGLYRLTTGYEESVPSFDYLTWSVFSKIQQYKITGDAEQKTLDQDEENPSLSAILNDWWLDNYDIYRKVDAYHTTDKYSPFYLVVVGWVSRDWFTGRRHLTTEELAEEMEG